MPRHIEKPTDVCPMCDQIGWKIADSTASDIYECPMGHVFSTGVQFDNKSTAIELEID